jgi:hypothetical protein
LPSIFAQSFVSASELADSFSRLFGTIVDGIGFCSVFCLCEPGDEKQLNIARKLKPLLVFWGRWALLSLAVLELRSVLPALSPGMLLSAIVAIDQTGVIVNDQDPVEDNE